MKNLAKLAGVSILNKSQQQSVYGGAIYQECLDWNGSGQRPPCGENQDNSDDAKQ